MNINVLARSISFITEESYGKYFYNETKKLFIYLQVDIDIEGISNSHSVNEIRLYSSENPYFPLQEIQQRRLTKSIKFTEQYSKHYHSFDDPKMLLFYNSLSKNR